MKTYNERNKKMKITNVNNNIGKFKRIKLCIGAIIGSIILAGCSINGVEVKEPSPSPTEYSVTVNFEKDEVTEQEDLVLLADDEGNIYHGFRSTQETVHTTVPTDDVYLIDEELDIKEKLPEINENEEYIITINYETKEYYIETVSKTEELKK